MEQLLGSRFARMVQHRQAGARVVMAVAGGALFGLGACFFPNVRAAAATVHYELVRTADHAHAAPPPAPAPVARIPVEPLGFQPPSRFYLPYRVPRATLDFIDDTHILFTFHVSALMHRQDDEPEDDNDQVIRALVIELPSGKVQATEDWRMHDSGRYLWSLGNGQFLLRQRNDLYLLNKALGRTEYLHTSGRLSELELSPGGSTMMVEYELPVETTTDKKLPGVPTLGDDVPYRTSHKTRLLIVDNNEKKVMKAATLSRPVTLAMLQNGYLDVKPSAQKSWTAQLIPFEGEPRSIVQLNSSCQPELLPVSETSFLAMLCTPTTTDHLVQAYSLDGRKLWEQQWESRYVWGTFNYAANGSRFAYGSIQLNHPISTLDPVDETAMTGQPVGVFDVSDGTLRMVESASPILSAGENFSLTADGRKLAILRDGNIEVYDMPAAAPVPLEHEKVK